MLCFISGTSGTLAPVEGKMKIYMKPETQRWIDAGSILAKDPDAVIKCPECTVGILIVKDEAIGDGKIRFDRYLICNNCGKWNILSMRYPESPT